MQEQRLPPQNIEAEQSVLGAMFLEKEAIDKVEHLLSPPDFYRPAHQAIYQAILNLSGKGDAADLVTVPEALRRENKLDDVGGIPYITYLANTVPTAANITFHARIVAEKAVLRRLVSAGTRIAGMGYEESGDVAATLDTAEQEIMNVGKARLGNSFVPIREIVHAAFDRIMKAHDAKGGITGTATGFVDFDKLTAGLQPADLVILAGRPSMGKTALALNIAQHVALREKKPLAFFSLEMSKEQLVQRLLCAEARIDSQKLKSGELAQDDFDRLVRAADTLSKCNIFIDETPGLTIMDLRGKARRFQREQKIELVLIDYLQLMQGRAGSENRQQEISEISRSLKALAKELNLPLIALSQLSRGVENRQSKIPMLSDLRESGSLEQDADIVAFLYREDYYNTETSNENITDLIVAKHRNGPVGKIQLYFEKRFTLFRNYGRIGEP
ncbi:MAG: replicative DNA helicase [Acidaminococcales bacterium]|jgi:replicative DNA helicase|nr:replicative DNA helicase [Acidaminococcales bacterium]